MYNMYNISVFWAKIDKMVPKNAKNGHFCPNVIQKPPISRYHFIFSRYHFIQKCDF